MVFEAEDSTVCCLPKVNDKKGRHEKNLGWWSSARQHGKYYRVMDFKRLIIVHNMFSEYFTRYYAKCFFLFH